MATWKVGDGLAGVVSVRGLRSGLWATWIKGGVGVSVWIVAAWSTDPEGGAGVVCVWLLPIMGLVPWGLLPLRLTVLTHYLGLSDFGYCRI